MMSIFEYFLSFFCKEIFAENQKIFQKMSYQSSNFFCLRIRPKTQKLLRKTFLKKKHGDDQKFFGNLRERER